MNPGTCIGSLRRSGLAIAAIYEGVPDAALRRRPAPDRWSPLEILCHLVDEEQDDFRARIQSTLEDPDATWPAIDPPAWAIERAYNEKDPRVALTSFRMERAESLAWLAGLEAEALERAHEHPKLGVLRVGDLLAAWAAHDLMHLRQVAGVLVEGVGEAATPYSTRYAGP